MTDSTTVARGTAICENCGSVFAARIWPDGRIRPIGSPANCPCGGTEFRRLS
ncbi:hypothetical protein JMJ58_08545 [Haloterrigena salifodinae]|uniref:Uncharacterized protein n=1 Tax=Haloterrigena salifodinae TaxID=2675099 RepID=A0A8T8E579_9EURY|nr:hypothetical protein [Haloterrigena salifodinae]QRV16899.1 hypothetical protein JMJ58_08545 [Haloterrigena salifodinae]